MDREMDRIMMRRVGRQYDRAIIWGQTYDLVPVLGVEPKELRDE